MALKKKLYENLDRLRDFLRHNSAEEALERFESLDRDTVIALKQLVDYEDRLEAGLKEAREVQTSVKVSCFFIFLAGAWGSLTGWWFEAKILTLINKYNHLIPAIAGICLCAFVNVYDSVKSYSWMDKVFEMSRGYMSDDFEEDGAKNYCQETRHKELLDAKINPINHV